MKVVEAIVKILEGIAYSVAIFTAIVAVLAFSKLIMDNWADMTIKIVNDFGHAIEVRCPEAIDYPVWRKMEVGLNCH